MAWHLPALLSIPGGPVSARRIPFAARRGARWPGRRTMNTLYRLARLPIVALDALLRRYYGVWEFTQDADCIFRVSLGHSPLTVTLSDGTRLHAGDAVCIIHLWNERVVQDEASESDLRRAISLLRRAERSLRLLATYAATEPRLHDVVAFGGETSVFSMQASGRPLDLLRRFGADYFEVKPPSSLLGRLRLFLDRGYAWTLVWVFNRAALRGKIFWSVGRGYVWISRARLMQYADRLS